MRPHSIVDRDVEVEVHAPEPGLAPEELLDRARALQPMLRERQAQCEELTHIPPETHEAFLDAGFYRTLQPRKFGGYEFGLRTFAQVVIEVARGCPSSGWNLALASNHSVLVAARFSEQAQREIFGPEGDFRAPLPVAPSGKALRSGDGYRINGRWDYASGCTVSTHFLAGAMIDDGNGRPPSSGLVCVPDGWQVLDNWGATIGMRGSGSNSVVVEDVLVPDRYVVHGDILELDLSSPTEGWMLHGNPLYAGQNLSFFNLVLVPIIIGAGWAALDEYRDLLQSRSLQLPPFVPRHEVAEHQRNYGLAIGKLEAAQRTLFETLDDYIARARRGAEGGEPFSTTEDRYLSVILREAGQLAADAVEAIAVACGTSAVNDGQRIQRYLRDVMVYKTHLNAQHGFWARRLGAELLGGERGD